MLTSSLTKDTTTWLSWTASQDGPSLSERPTAPPGSYLSSSPPSLRSVFRTTSPRTEDRSSPQHRLCSVANPHSNSRARPHNQDLPGHCGIRQTYTRPLPGKICLHQYWDRLLDDRETTMASRGDTELEKWSEHTRALPQLKFGDHVRLQNQTGPFPRRWEKTGTILQVQQFHQYWVRMSGSGRATLHNRKFLRKLNHQSSECLYQMSHCIHRNHNLRRHLLWVVPLIQ